MTSLCGRLAVFLATLVSVVAQTPLNEIVLVEPKMVTESAVAGWKNEHFRGVAVVLEDGATAGDLADVAKRISNAGLDLYYWIEVGRNPQMAAKNPLWMAALGMHGDWLRNFPNFPEPGIGEVAKAFPWAPIGYQETFLAHLARIDLLLKKAPANYRGLLINDLQGGPSSCGCGNVQCRWALDYHVPATATKLEGDDVAARFVAEVKKRAGDKQVIPVWTTECSEADLPSNKNGGKPSTGFCGKITCAHSACEEIFAAQFPLLAASTPAPIALLATHSSFKRYDPEFGGGPTWVTNAVAYVNQTLTLRGAKPIPTERLWAVVDGQEKATEVATRAAAAKTGVSGVIVARIHVEQSFEPRLLKIK